MSSYRKEDKRFKSQKSLIPTSANNPVKICISQWKRLCPVHFGSLIHKYEYKENEPENSELQKCHRV